MALPGSATDATIVIMIATNILHTLTWTTWPWALH